MAEAAPSAQCCGNCKFYKQLVGTNEGGCHRYPPIVVPVWTKNEYDIEFWSLDSVSPVVTRDYWCGEWK